MPLKAGSLLGHGASVTKTAQLAGVSKGTVTSTFRSMGKTSMIG